MPPRRRFFVGEILILKRHLTREAPRHSGGSPSDAIEPLRALVRILAKAAAEEEHSRNQGPDPNGPKR